MAEVRKLNAELWRAGVWLEAHYISSAQNVYADCLSSRPRKVYYFPCTTSVISESAWVGSIEADYTKSWNYEHYVRPHLELTPLELLKGEQEAFNGVILAPYWPSRP